MQLDATAMEPWCVAGVSVTVAGEALMMNFKERIKTCLPVRPQNVVKFL